MIITVVRAISSGMFVVACLATMTGFAQQSRVTHPKPAVPHGWQVKVEHDDFSGVVRCRLQAADRHIFYVAGAFGFEVKATATPSQIWFRIDNGAPASWRDVLPELARLKVAIDGRDLAKPTDGIMWLPAAMLDQASQVSIQAGFRKTPRTFALDGFAQAREKARVLGCVPEERFIR